METEETADIPCTIISKKHLNNVDNLAVEDLEDDVDQQQESFSNLTINPEAHHSSNIHSSFLDIIDRNGDMKKVRKSSIISLLTTGKNTLSSDRLRRVQNNSSNKPWCKRLEFISEEPGFSTFKAELLRIGDWCVFKSNKKMKSRKLNLDDLFNGNLVVGIAVAFRYNAKTHWQQMYKFDYTSTTPSENNEFDVEVLGSWHKFNKDGSLSPLEKNSHFYISIKNYIASLENPENFNCKIMFKDFEMISEKLLTFFLNFNFNCLLIKTKCNCF